MKVSSRMRGEASQRHLHLEFMAVPTLSVCGVVSWKGGSNSGLLRVCYRQENTQTRSKARAWRDDSKVKNAGFPSRGSRFDSQIPHSDSLPSLTPVQGESDTLLWPP